MKDSEYFKIKINFMKFLKFWLKLKILIGTSFKIGKIQIYYKKINIIQKIFVMN